MRSGRGSSARRRFAVAGFCRPNISITTTITSSTRCFYGFIPPGGRALVSPALSRRRPGDRGGAGSMRRGRAEAIFAALLFAANYWLVLCSTERGATPLAVCFALLAFYTLKEYLAHGNRRMLVLFLVQCDARLFRGTIFLHRYLLGLWSVYHGRGDACRPARAAAVLACHLVPCRLSPRDMSWTFAACSRADAAGTRSWSWGVC